MSRSWDGIDMTVKVLQIETFQPRFIILFKYGFAKLLIVLLQALY
jgi:hypothetical protein